MELRHLRYFVAVAEEENVSRAAIRLHVSQPAVSRQIRDLEEEIELRLFERGAKSLRLTEPGRVFLEEARAVLRRAEEAVKKARDSAAATEGEIHVGYAPSLTLQLLPRALRAFAGKYPKVRVKLHDLSTEEMLFHLNGQKVQVALMVKQESKMMRSFEVKQVARYPLCVAMPLGDPLSKLETIRLEEVADRPFVAYNRENYPEYHGFLDKLFGAIGRKINLTGEHDSVTSILAAVESGAGLAILPACVNCMTGGRLKLVELTPTVELTVIAAWLKEPAIAPIVQRFVDVC